MKIHNDADLAQELSAAMSAGDWKRSLVIDADLARLEGGRVKASLHAAALWYCSIGLKVFPLSPGSKIPHRGSNGCRGASNQHDVVDGWWTDHPDSNIGIATGHLVDVVDIDGLQGQTSRAQNWGMFDNLEVLGSVLTPRPGGMHLYVPARPGISNGAGLLPGVDYRGDGGYVVAPPSFNEQGGYRWLAPVDGSALGSVAA